MNEPLRILSCSQNPLDPRLGAPKVLIELADAIRSVGSQVELVAPSDLVPGLNSAIVDGPRYRRALRDFIRSRAGKFDVVEVDHEHLPFPRNELPESMLLVARSVLLSLHERSLRIPRDPSLRSTLSWWLKRRWQMSARIDRALQTMRSADLINVSNEDDRRALVAHGFADSKIVVLPYGLSDERLTQLAATPAPLGDRQVIAFVGTFDYRKGCLDFPRLADHVVRELPTAKFRLIGTRGLFKTEADVRAFFPAHLQRNIEVVPEFEPRELPGLLQGARVGVFPSYWEGFGFGVLEMLASGLPVVAYDAPGPGMMLSSEWLVRAGDVDAMASRVLMLLNDRERLMSERMKAKEVATRFRWKEIAQKTIDAYARAIERKAGS
jgi:glycosyltransferase involved in cell wall biosynthesis